MLKYSLPGTFLGEGGGGYPRSLVPGLFPGSKPSSQGPVAGKPPYRRQYRVVPPFHSQQTDYAAGGTPLAVMQEDFSCACMFTAAVFSNISGEVGCL